MLLLQKSLDSLILKGNPNIPVILKPLRHKFGYFYLGEDKHMIDAIDGFFEFYGPKSKIDLSQCQEIKIFYRFCKFYLIPVKM